MLFTIVVSVFCAPSILGAPVRSNAIPSIHPLTGPTPPVAAEVPHGLNRQWVPLSNSGRRQGRVKGTPGSAWSGWKDVQKLFVFGDSYSQSGFDPTLAQPSREFPLGNPSYPGYTSSNGPNYVDYLTTTYNLSLVETYNLAYGGATVDADLVEPYEPTVLSLRQQVNDEFFPYYVDEATAEWTSSNSLFIAFMGINDVGNSYYLQNNTINGDIINVYSGLVDELYDAGARNFLFMNVPPVNLAPLTVGEGASAQALEAQDITDFNDRIQRMASNFSTYADTTVFYFDTNAVFSRVLTDPSTYPQTAGYRNTTDYCDAYENGTAAEDTFDAECGIPVNEYFWLNTLHPTYPMHEALAQEIAKQLEGGMVVKE